MIKQFEYKLEKHSNRELLTPFLNDNGLIGWELVTIKFYDEENYYYFKREIERLPSPDYSSTGGASNTNTTTDKP